MSLSNRKAQFAKRGAEIQILEAVCFDAREHAVAATDRNFKHLGDAVVKVGCHVGGKEVVFGFESFVVGFHHVEGASANLDRDRNREVIDADREKFHETAGRHVLNHMLFGNVIAPITQLQRIFDDVNDALIYAEGFFDILNSDSEIEQSGTYRPEKIRGEFKLAGVDFTYPNGNKALFGVDMTIEPGRITALVGLSGAGKSTIVNLLDKFYEPQAGTITLDGVDLREYDTKYLRDNIGLVLQKNHIFDGTIEENILYGKPGATHDEVVEAARKACILDQIMALPQQFNNKATDLSGGQQQRIAIARMFLKNPPVIFLDEPTASLDAIATEQIKNSIDAIKKDRTVIIISHSISQIIDSDMVYALQKGRVEQSGHPDEVYKKGGVYKDIIDASARSLNIGKIARTISPV